ncbi:MAG: penicillin acylase family protein [Acidobacteriota bacterium]|nr:penicillin acylase family protein [Acidobacteriota bacterium]
MRRRKRLWPRVARWSATILFACLVLGVVAAAFWLRSAARAALPQLDGKLQLHGLSAPVLVRRDAHGIPHIQAAAQADLFFTQGYVTAQDRLWQMDMFRRNASGTLAEVLGPSLVRHDIAQRVLEFRNVAARIAANMPADDRARFEEYAAGINLYIQQHPDTLPPEFHLLHYRPEPWTVVDSIAVGVMMVQTLDTHWDVKLTREQIASRLHNPRIESELYPVGSWRDRPPTGEVLDLSKPHPEPAPPAGSDDEDDDRSQASALPDPDLTGLRDTLGLPACDACASGSNNWVIAGAHTASSRPLLSNDMHLSLGVPDIWYMADLAAPGYHAAGVTLPGLPYIVEGHNEHVAWGYTALFADVQDLYIEKLDGHGHFLAADGSWQPIGVDHETIRVRGGHDLSITVQVTPHGPLLNPILNGETRPIALRWTLYDSTLNSLPLYAMNTAASWSDFSAALAQWCWPTQNLVYADDQGHIAYQAIGRVPLRPAGLQGVPIADAHHEWQSYIPFDSLPNAVDPPAGFLATANARVTTEKSPYPLSLEWSDPYRIERIYKSLQGRDQLNPADMLALQTDVYSEVDQELGQRFAYAIDHADHVDDRLRAAADLLRTWDGRLTPDSAPASIVTQTRKALGSMLLEPKLGKDAALYRWSESNFALEEIVMHAYPQWLPPGYKDWDNFLADTVRKAMDQGKAPANVSLWTYGSWHILDLEHPLATFLPFLRGIAGSGSHPLSGDVTTVKQASGTVGPSQRFTMDWSNIDGSTENITLGENGNLLSPYFRDQWSAYSNGTTFPLPFTSDAVAAQAQHTLRLVP